MKKVLMSVALVSAIAIAAGYSMIGSDKSKMNMSDLAQANVEAFADPMCENGCKGSGNGCLCHYWFPTYGEAVEPLE